jgi:transposase
VKDKKFAITKDQFYSLYNKGPDALYSLFSSILDTANQLLNTVEKLELRIKELESQLNKDSHNSNNPPSSDGLKKKNKTNSLRKKSDKKIGGQKGHAGKTLEMVKNPDKITKIKVKICSCCGKPLDKEKVQDYEKRQVIELPEIKPVSEEFQAEIKTCSHCNTVNVAEFPENITNKIQYGIHLKSILIYLRHQNFMPCERLRELFEDVFHVSLSEGTIINTSNKCGELLSNFEEWIKTKLLEYYVLHFDESGIRIDGSLYWVHSISNFLLTYYYPHKRRGKEAIEEIGILPKFTGVAIHDYWKSYLEYSCKHGLCNAHHLRELTYFYEEMNQDWAGKMLRLLLKIKEEVDKEKENGRLIDERKMKNYIRRYNLIINEGLKVNPYIKPEIKKRGRKGKGKILNFLERFKYHMKYVLAFMFDLNVPFDNNQAERDIRMAKLHQKISGCFRSTEGAKNFFRIRSFISTIKKNRLNIINSIEKIFNNYSINDIIPTE